MAFGLGFVKRGAVKTLSLIGTSIVLEAQPAVVASIPLGFHPLTGIVISIAANLIPIPLFIVTFQEIITRWKWFRHKLEKAEKWTLRYERYGIWILIPLSPFLGAYVCIGIGLLMRWRTSRILLCVIVGMVFSTVLIAYGGHSLFHLLHLGHYFHRGHRWHRHGHFSWWW